MDDDFNTPGAVAVLFELAAEINRETLPPLANGEKREPLAAFVADRMNGATRISVRLGSPDGVATQIIDGNEWKPTDGSWHFLLRGDRYSMMAARGDGLAVLRIVARNRIAVEHLRTTINGRRLEVTPDWLEIDGKRYVDKIGSGTLIGLEL